MSFTKQQQVLLEELFLAGAVLVGDAVRQRTGLNTPIYFNLREPLHTHPELLWKVGREFAMKICQLAGTINTPQCVVGVPDAATPLAAATALYAAQHFAERAFSCGLLRKKVSTSARPRTDNMEWIGPREEGCAYTLIDDVVASGMTKRSAVAAMNRAGIPLRRIIVLFDREQGDGLREEGFELYSIFTAADVVDFYVQRGLISAAAHSEIRQFLAMHRFDNVTVSSAK